jgi:hypothetical protein
MQAGGKHKALDKSSQARADPDATKQYRDSLSQISLKSQQMNRDSKEVHLMHSGRILKLQLSFKHQYQEVCPGNAVICTSLAR